MKTILLHVQDDPSLDDRLEAALSLARAFSAHLVCLHVTPIEAYAAVGAFDGANLMSDVMDALERGEAAVRSKVRDQMAAANVSWEYEQVTGPVASIITRHAALADLVVTGREGHSSKAPWSTQISLLGDLLHRCRTPLFIPASTAIFLNPTGPALIAWDGSYEASNAIRASLAFLKAASKVAILQVEKKAEENFPVETLIDYLSRHGIRAEPRSAAADHEQVATTIVEEAVRMGNATIVMGGYNHSRIGELVFGGVTRTLLADCPTALLMAH